MLLTFIISLTLVSIQTIGSNFLIFFRPGSLKETILVTFELRSKGFKDSDVLRNTLKYALQRQSISSFSVSPDFELNQGKN